MSDFPFSIPRRDTPTAQPQNPFNHIQLTDTAVVTVPTANPPYERSSTTGTKLTQLSGLTITPTSATQKVVLQLTLFGEWQTNSHSASLSFKRVVGGTETWLDARAGDDDIGSRKPANGLFAITFYANDNDSTPEVLSITYVDEPGTTSPVEYDIYLINTSVPTTFNLNRTKTDSDDKNYERGVSTFTLECKGD